MWEINDRWRIHRLSVSSTLGGSRTVIRAGNTPLEYPPSSPPSSTFYIFTRGRGCERAVRARVGFSDFLPSCLASAISHYVICIRVATPLTSSPPGIPIKETHLRAIRAILPPSLAHEGHRAAPRRHEQTDAGPSNPLFDTAEWRKFTMRPFAASMLSFLKMQLETRNPAQLERGAQGPKWSILSRKTQKKCAFVKHFTFINIKYGFYELNSNLLTEKDIE